MKSKLVLILACCAPLLQSACVVVPAQPAYVTEPSVVVVPAPVVVKPGYGRREYRRY